MCIARVAMGIVPCMGNYKVPEDPLGEVRAIGGDSGARDDWKEDFLHSRDRRPSDKAPADPMSMFATKDLMGMFATKLENLGGIDASRIEAILRGAEATDDEFESIRYACNDLMRALKDE